jgi:methyl-accepting chemotaxis protein
MAAVLPHVFPFGLLELDARGIVVRYSPAIEQDAPVREQDILGRNFFTEVAPCEQVSEVKSRFLAFMAFGDAVQKFSITLPVEQQSIKIQIMLARVTERLEQGRERLALVRIMPERQVR